MKNKIPVYPKALWIGFCLLIVCSATSTVAATLRVPSDYPTIQSAIDAAVDGDEVLVADGTYTGEGNKDLDFSGKAIAVRSMHGPETAIIDAEGAGRAATASSSAWVTTPATAVMLLPLAAPVIALVCGEGEHRTEASFEPALLLAIAYGASLGGMATLIGTPPNIIVSTFRQDRLGEPYQMFDYLPVGGAVAVGIGRRLGAVGATGLPQDAAHVVGGRVLADHQRRADLAVAQATGDEAQDLDLARRQPVGQRLRRRGRLGADRADARQQRALAVALGDRGRLAQQRDGARGVPARDARTRDREADIARRDADHAAAEPLRQPDRRRTDAAADIQYAVPGGDLRALPAPYVGAGRATQALAAAALRRGYPGRG